SRNYLPPDASSADRELRVVRWDADPDRGRVPSAPGSARAPDLGGESARRPTWADWRRASWENPTRRLRRRAPAPRSLGLWRMSRSRPDADPGLRGPAGRRADLSSGPPPGSRPADVSHADCPGAHGGPPGD